MPHIPSIRLLSTRACDAYLSRHSPFGSDSINPPEDPTESSSSFPTYRDRRLPSSRQKAYQYGPCGQVEQASFPQRTNCSRSRTREPESVSRATPRFSRRARARMTRRRKSCSFISRTASRTSRSIGKSVPWPVALAMLGARQRNLWQRRTTSRPFPERNHSPEALWGREGPERRSSVSKMHLTVH